MDVVDRFAVVIGQQVIQSEAEHAVDAPAIAGQRQQQAAATDPRPAALFPALYGILTPAADHGTLGGLVACQHVSPEQLVATAAAHPAVQAVPNGGARPTVMAAAAAADGLHQ